METICAPLEPPSRHARRSDSRTSLEFILKEILRRRYVLVGGCAGMGGMSGLAIDPAAGSRPGSWQRLAICAGVWGLIGPAIALGRRRRVAPNWLSEGLRQYVVDR